MSKKIHNKNEELQRGQSIIEFIVALSIMLIVVSGGTTVIIGSLKATDSVETRTEALGLANEGISAVKSIRNQGWDNLENGMYGVSNSSGSWALTSEPNLIDEKYTREISINTADINGDTTWEVKRVTSTIRWNQTQTEEATVETNVYLSNWLTARAMVEGGPEYGTCNDYCLSIGYSSGNCWGLPFFCWLYGRDYIPYGSQFCLGGTWSDTCCCKP